MKTFILGLILVSSGFAKDLYRVCVETDEGTACTEYNLSLKDAKLVGRYLHSFVELPVYAEKKPKAPKSVPVPKESPKPFKLGEGEVILLSVS